MGGGRRYLRGRKNPLKESAGRLHLSFFFVLMGGSNLAGAIFGLKGGNRHLSPIEKRGCFFSLEFTFDLWQFCFLQIVRL